MTHFEKRTRVGEQQLHLAENGARSVLEMDDTKRIVVKFVEELWNQRNLAVADSIFDEDCRTYQLLSGSPVVAAPRGAAVIQAHVTEWVSAFPDLRFTVEQMFADGDRVISQLVMDGTQTGQWLGIPPTRSRVSVRMITIHRIRKGKIVEDWVLVEWLGVLQQLGALPPTEIILRDCAQRHK